VKVKARAGLAAIVIVLAAGVWLFVAPLIVDYQNDWKNLAGEATTNDVWSGGILVAITALTPILFGVFALRDAARAAARRRANAEKRLTETNEPVRHG
jgi:cytochrome c oxidase assembly factor CtaG